MTLKKPMKNYEVVSTLPSNPYDGQVVILSITGRKLLMTYIDGEWHPEHSFGETIFYVDIASGTDSKEKGTASGVDAFATRQYAIDQMPGSFDGNVIIYDAGGTNTEVLTIQGKRPTGNYNITLIGTLSLQETVSSATVAAGSGATQGVVTKVGAFTGDSYSNLLCYFVADDAYRRIDSHTNDALTLVGTAPSSTTQDIKIYSNDTVLGTYIIKENQKNVVFENIGFSNFGTSITIVQEPFSSLKLTRVDINNASTAQLKVQANSSLFIDTCYSEDVIFFFDFSNVFITRTKYYGTPSVILAPLGLSFIELDGGTILDGKNGSDGGSKGFSSAELSYVKHTGSTANGLVRIRNFDQAGDVGAFVQRGGQALTANIQYSNNTTDEALGGTQATDPAYIH